MKTLKIPLIVSISLLTSLAGVARAADPGIYPDIVAPLMEAKCVQCHGEEKQKGKLRLDTHAFIMRGADEEQIVFPGKLDEGSFFERLYLPLDDDDHMPPEDEEQLTKDEIRLLEWWVKEGAKKDLTIAKANKPKDLEPVIAAFLKSVPTKSVAGVKKEPTAAEKKAAEEAAKRAVATMEKVNATGASLMPISSENEAELRFTALNVAKEFGDAQLAALEPVAGQILWLDLAGTKVTDKGLAQVAGMKNLKRLYLQNTGVGDAGLNHLRGLAGLEYLNLYASKVSDAGIAKLGGLKNLKSLYVWQTKVTAKGAAGLEKKISGLDANIGWTDKDNAVVVASAAPPKPAAAPKREEAKKPAPKKEAAPAAVTDAKALADAKVAAAQAKKKADDAAKAAAAARRAAAAAQKKVEELESKAKAAAGAKKPAPAPAKPAAKPKGKAKPAPQARPKPQAKPQPARKVEPKKDAKPKESAKPKN